MCSLSISLSQIPRVYCFHYIIISDILKEVRKALLGIRKPMFTSQVSHAGGVATCQHLSVSAPFNLLQELKTNYLQTQTPSPPVNCKPILVVY